MIKNTSTQLRKSRGLCKARGVTGIPYVTYNDVATVHGGFFMLTMHEMQQRTSPRRGEFYTRMTVDGERQDVLVLAYYRYKELHTDVQHKLTNVNKKGGKK